LQSTDYRWRNWLVKAALGNTFLKATNRVSIPFDLAIVDQRRRSSLREIKPTLKQVTFAGTVGDERIPPVQ
jgi:hypothetical protein